MVAVGDATMLGESSVSASIRTSADSGALGLAGWRSCGVDGAARSAGGGIDDEDDEEEDDGCNNDAPGPKSSSPCALCRPASEAGLVENSNPAPSNRDALLPTLRFSRFSGEPTSPPSWATPNAGSMSASQERFTSKGSDMMA